MKLELKIQLTPVERNRLTRPVNGRGGFQVLLRKLQKRLKGNTVTLTSVDEIEKVGRYLKKYGKGGFQSRIASLE